MLTIAQRFAKIGSSVNTRTERHGDTDVTALDIPLSGIPIDEDDLNALLCEPNAHGALYADDEPAIRCLAPLKLKEKIEKASVSIWLGMADNPVKFTDCNLAKVTLELKAGGTTEMSVQVQCTPTLDKAITRLLENLNHECRVEIVVEGYGEQKDLLEKAA